MRQVVAVGGSGRWPGFEMGEGSAHYCTTAGGSHAETLADHQGARSVRKVGVGRLAAAGRRGRAASTSLSPLLLREACARRVSRVCVNTHAIHVAVE
jgi:hypothetical protein